MPLCEYYRIGADGKVVAGWTVLRDPQTGRLYDVERVMSGRMPRPEMPHDPRGSTTEACALNWRGRIRRNGRIIE